MSAQPNGEGGSEKLHVAWISKPVSVIRWVGGRAGETGVLLAIKLDRPHRRRTPVSSRAVSF